LETLAEKAPRFNSIKKPKRRVGVFDGKKFSTLTTTGHEFDIDRRTTQSALGSRRPTDISKDKITFYQDDYVIGETIMAESRKLVTPALGTIRMKPTPVTVGLTTDAQIQKFVPDK
jgi:hypothetical protein